MINRESVKRLGFRHGKPITVQVVNKPQVDYKSGNPATNVIRQYVAYNTIALDNTNKFRELVLSFNKFQTGNAANFNQKVFLFQAVYKIELHNLIIENGITYKVVHVETLDNNSGSVVRGENVT